MSCYFIVTIDMDQPDKLEIYQEYVRKVKPIVEQYGGEYLVRTNQIQEVFGGWHPDKVLVLRFKDREAFDVWYHSKEYAEIKDLRTQSVTSKGILVEGV